MKKTAILLLLFAKILIGQEITIKDTINATTMEKFKVPAEKNIIFANVMKIAFDVTLLDASLNPIRKCSDFYQYPSNQELKKKVSGGRGANVQFAVFERVDDEGIYYVKINVKLKDEYKTKKLKPVYYMVKVKYPEIVAPIQLNEKGYYYSEHKSFSFATVQFKNPNLYSYKILSSSGELIEEHQGSIVVLDSVLSELKYVGQTIKVIGYYNGKPFKYREIGKQEVHNTEWKISIKRPALDEFTDWHNIDNKNEDEAQISAWNKKAMRILYAYFGQTENGFVVVTPKTRGVVVEAEPQGLIATYRPIQQGTWLFVQFELNQDYLDELEEFAQIDAKIHVRFKTQFNESVDRTYEATIYK